MSGSNGRGIAAILLLPALLCLAALITCESSPSEADLVLRNGKIITLDPARPEARWLAARGGTIAALGSGAGADAHIGPGTRVIDLDGAVAVPGFIDGHGHFLSLGRASLRLDLKNVTSWEAVVGMVTDAAKAAGPGRRIEGRGWHQEKWAALPDRSVEGMPTHHGLTDAAPENPVILTHESGHACIVNALAMEEAGLTAETADPVGGRIVRDPSDRPTGLLREKAMDLVRRRSIEDPETLRRIAALAARECVSKGLTSFQDAASTFEEIDFLQSEAEAGTLGIRLWAMIDGEEEAETLAERLPAYRIEEAGDGFLTVRAVKMFMDGALGSHGAWLLEPYADMPGSTGLCLSTPGAMDRTAALCAKHGFQLCTHAIGDRANREVLDLYERHLRPLPDGAARRWRIEHAQHLHPDDVPRFAALGILASMQPIHCVSDGPWVPLRIGEERAARGAYLWRTLLDAGVHVSSGTDTPVEDPDPIANFHAAVTRALSDGSRFHPEQCMTRMEALRAATIDAAYAAFEEDRKGSLEAGKVADITVLSRDLLEIPEDEIPSIRVLYTILNGKVAYEEAPPS